MAKCITDSTFFCQLKKQKKEADKHNQAHFVHIVSMIDSFVYKDNPVQ